MKITEKQVVRSLQSFHRTGTYVMINNIHMYGCFESDFLRVTMSKYSTEFEVKLSVADFKADARKSIGNKSKYEYMQLGLGANSFAYVVPRDILDKIEVPEWAGLFVFDIYKRIRSEPLSDYNSVKTITMVKPYKKLHKKKVTEKKIDQI